MLKHFLKVISFAYCLVLYAVIADAQLPQISSGLSYLASSQKKQEKGQRSKKRVRSTLYMN